MLATLAALVLSAPNSGVEVLVITGGTDEASARANLDKWNTTYADSKTRLAFAPGFPTLVKSDTLPGLKPGFFIIVGGFCAPANAKTALIYLRSLEAGAYSKPLSEAQPLNCPFISLARVLAVAKEHPARPKSLPNLVAVTTSFGVEVLNVEEGRVTSTWLESTPLPEASEEFGEEASVSDRRISVESDAYVVDVKTALWQPSQMCRTDQTITYRVGLKGSMVMSLKRTVGKASRECGE